MRQIVIPLLVAAFLWFFMFSPWTSEVFNFWTAMSFSAIVLMNMAFALRPQWWAEDVKFDWRNLAGGVALAAALWGIFWVGDKVSAWLFSFARPQVELIYGMKAGGKPLATLHSATYLDRTCGRDFLARVCAKCTVQTLESECRLYCDDTGLCAGAYLVV